MCEGMIMKRKTVLVIEDNEMNMKLVRALLQIGQYDILEAVDAESGIPLARAHKPDLILMDVHVPGMDGLSATRIIKEDPALKADTGHSSDLLCDGRGCEEG